MIQITKEEADLVKRRFPNVYITITNRQKGGDRKQRYVEESSKVLALIMNHRQRSGEKKPWDRSR